MYLSPSRRLLLAPLSLLMAALVACAPTEEVASSPDGSPSPASTASPSPSPSPSASPSPTQSAGSLPTAGAPAGDDDQGSDQDRVGASGDCDAYLDSSGWCTNGIGDFDCEGGSGNGPNYAPPDISLVEPGVDPFGLDRNNDGVGCEQAQPVPPPPDPQPEPGTDPRFGTCAEAKAAGYGPYYRSDAEYSWYRDADSDGVVCE